MFRASICPDTELCREEPLVANTFEVNRAFCDDNIPYGIKLFPIGA